MNLREKRAAETVSEILKAAEELFGKEGYESTTVNDIVRKCGMTKGAFYYYFKTKDEVLDRLFTDHYNAIYETATPVIKNTDLSWEEKLKEIISLSRGIGLSKKSFVSEYINIRHNNSDLFMKERLKKCDIENYKKIIAEVLEQGKASGDCDFTASGEVMSVFIYHIDIAVTEEVNIIVNTNQSNILKEEKLKALLEGALQTLSAMLGVNSNKMRTIVDPESGLEFFKSIIRKNPE